MRSCQKYSITEKWVRIESESSQNKHRCRSRTRSRTVLARPRSPPRPKSYAFRTSKSLTMQGFPEICVQHRGSWNMCSISWFLKYVFNIVNSTSPHIWRLRSRRGRRHRRPCRKRCCMNCAPAEILSSKGKKTCRFRKSLRTMSIISSNAA